MQGYPSHAGGSGPNEIFHHLQQSPDPLCSTGSGPNWITPISVQWKQLQAEHYQSIDLRRSLGKWAAGLITNILSVTHSQWLHQCTMLHERNAQQLKLKQGRDLATNGHSEPTGIGSGGATCSGPSLHHPWKCLHSCPSRG
jgi:hypothetical protein